MLKFIILSLFFISQAIAFETTIKYNRKTWKHWTDHDHNCLDTRTEILKARSLIPVTMNKKGCKVKAGKWQDYYFNETLIEAKNVDIDHLVPLKNAHDSGGADWSFERKEKFANDPENLVVTNKKYNRTKSSKGIDQWLPVELSYTCKYVRQWIKIKTKYKLEIKPQEIVTINLLKTKCPL